jgi:hypothetical protein
MTLLTLPLLKVGPLQHVDTSGNVHDRPGITFVAAMVMR